MATLKAIMIGDVVGEPGLKVLEAGLPALIREHTADFVVVNGENAADGFGLTDVTLKRILDAGADVVTSGNHVWEKREFWPTLDDNEAQILRPANYPEGTPGQGWIRIEKNDVHWCIINLQGRELMTPIDCPFRTFDAILKQEESSAAEIHPLFEGDGSIPDVYNDMNSIILVDFHAESFREKESLGYYLDGRASLVIGTHTHVQTADERILPQGTGYISDLGMTGVINSIIGMDQKICLDRARTQILYRMEVAADIDGRGTAIQGVVVEIDPRTRKTVSIQRIS